MAPRLKVFVTSDGLTDFVVAASSRAKALAAWGSHQDLFKTGLAHETDDPALVKGATARPGEVLRRPAGAPGALAAMRSVRKAAAKPAGLSRAALRKVAELEAQLSKLRADEAVAQAAIEKRRAALDREAEALTSRFAGRRAALEARLSKARQAQG